nr:MAG TPA: chromosome segregation ATPase [Caudoviricetes sp.]
MLEESISQSETRGWIVSKKYYDALTKNAKENINELKKERDSLVSALNTAVDSGTIDEYSESWFNMKSQINEVTEAIKESETSILDYAKSIREIDWQIFDLIQDKISNVADEAQFLIDLMDNKKLYEDNGQLTDVGMATMGQYGVKYNVYMNQADRYAKKIKELQADLAKDPYNQDIANQLQEYIEAQQEVILNAEDMKNSIKDMVEEGINKELDALQKLIDKYNDSLDSAKDLYDYQKKVKEHTKEIADLEKQMAAYQNDTSEEAKSKIQQIKVDLEDAKSDLEETEYDKYISDQQKLLDDLYTEYETILNMRLDDIDALIADMIAQINDNSASIGQTIEEQANNVGYTLSQSMQTIWLSGNGSISNVITTYGNKFDTAWTTTNKALGDINTNVQNMISQLNKLADTDIKAAGAPEPTPAPAPAPAPTPAPAPAQKASDDQMMGIAASIWVYGNGSGWGNDPVRSGRVTEKFDAATAEQVQSLINAHGPNGDLYSFWVNHGYNLDGYKYNAFKSGGRNIGETQMAWTQENKKREFIVRPSDGAILTPIAKGDSVLSPTASGNIWSMANSPADFIKDNLDINDIDTNAGSNNRASYTQNLDKVVFNLPNVKNYDEMLNAMQKDKNFERLILSMSIDRLAGKSSLAKGKAIR